MIFKSQTAANPRTLPGHQYSAVQKLYRFNLLIFGATKPQHNVTISSLYAFVRIVFLLNQLKNS